MKKRNWLVLLFCLMLPVSAMAVTEGVVEEAPMVDIQATAQEVSYLPDASYYAMDTWKCDWEDSETYVKLEKDEYGDYIKLCQNPHLTAGEIKRAQKLLEDYQAGTITYTGESVLNKTENVIVGVYALDPVNYDGERDYAILPGTCLTDEQLLSIIAAYDEMGLNFDPTGLSYRNCARGGGIETSRFFTEEEAERYQYTADLIRRGKLAPPENLPNLEMFLNLRLQSEYFSGLMGFSIKPYRSMTDVEIVSMLVSRGVHDETDEIDHDNVESRARTDFYTKLAAPLSMKLEDISIDASYVDESYTADGSVGYDNGNYRTAYSASFTYHAADGNLVHAIAFYDKTTNELVSIGVMHNSSNQCLEISGAVTQEKIDAAVAKVEARLSLSGIDWHTVWADATTTNWGKCVPVRAQVEDGWFLTIYIGGDDGCEHGLQLSKGTLVDKISAADQRPNG